MSARPAFAGRDSVPDWVHAAVAQTLPVYSPDTKAVVLLDETTVSVGADGKAVEHCRYVVKILRPSGREDGMVYVPYDGERKVISLHVWSISPDGHEYAVRDNEIVDRSYLEGNMYADLRVRVVTPPGRDPGGVVAYEYEQKIPSYLREEHWQFQDDLPRVTANFTLELPQGWTYGTVWAHHEQVKPVDLERNRVRWEANSTPGVDLDHVPMHPSLGALAGRMTVYYGPSPSGGELNGPSLGSWKGVGEWYEEISHERLQPSPEIAAKANELVAGKQGFYDRAEAIGEFVQKQIRYFAVERGIGGLQPHAATETFTHRYGDCKDKATLLSAMLSSVGIHSVIVLVDTHRGVVDVDAPSLYGNHAIAAIEIPKGYESPKLRSVVTTRAGRRYLIFDPTWEKTAFGQLEANLQGSYGTLVDGADSDEVLMPILSPELNTIRRTANFELQPDGTLKGSIVEKRFGDLSDTTRYLYAYENENERKRYMDRQLGRDFVAFDVSNLKVENVESLNKDLTMSYGLSAERYSRTAGPLLMVRPRVMGSDIMEFDHKARKVPVDLEQTMRATDDFTIDMPTGYTVDEMPDAIKLDVGFASYESSTEMHGNQLHYMRTFTVRQVVVPAERYADVLRLAGVIGADEQNHAIFKKQ